MFDSSVSEPLKPLQDEIADNISLRRFLFFPLPLLFRRLSTVFFIDSETKEAIPFHF